MPNTSQYGTRWTKSIRASVQMFAFQLQSWHAAVGEEHQKIVVVDWRRSHRNRSQGIIIGGPNNKYVRKTITRDLLSYILGSHIPANQEWVSPQVLWLAIHHLPMVHTYVLLCIRKFRDVPSPGCRVGVALILWSLGHIAAAPGDAEGLPVR